MGLRAVIAVSFARIHWQNLANFGVLALEFDDPSDLERAEQGDQVEFTNLGDSLLSGTQLTVKIGDREVAVHHRLSDRQVQMVLAGGRIPLIAQEI